MSRAERRLGLVHTIGSSVRAILLMSCVGLGCGSPTPAENVAVAPIGSSTAATVVADAAPPLATHVVTTASIATWTAAATPTLDLDGIQGKRYSVRHNLFESGGFRFTWTLVPDQPARVGRIELFARTATLEDARTRIDEALARLGFVAPVELAELFGRGHDLPARVDQGERLTKITWAPGWTGAVSLTREASDRWIVFLTAFLPQFVAPMDNW
jgi:hypothetical protein